jgi:hypothetical protein
MAMVTTAAAAENLNVGACVTGPCPSTVAATTIQPESQGTCFASDPDSNGATVAERVFRAAIRRSFERPAARGADGAVTIRFQSFKFGAPRRWTPNDGVSFSADQTKPIYDLRVGYTTCTDYRSSILLRQTDDNFECFTSPGGAHACQLSGRTGDLMQEKTQRIPK